MPLCECEYCQNVFNSVSGQKICPQCAKEIDEIFARIRKHMYSTSERVTAADLVEELDVSEKAVEYLIREGRLILDRSGKPVGKCRLCGAPTIGDSLCGECRKKFTEGVQKYREEKSQTKSVEPKKTGGSTSPLARIRREKDGAF